METLTKETATTTKWALDPTHSEVNFKLKHMMITNVNGTFTSFTATAETKGDDFSTGKISFSAQISSINTKNEQRDGHLKSADFFDAEKFPTIDFTSTAIKSTGGNTYELQGDLTIKGVTKNVKLTAELGGIAKDPWGNTKAGFSLTGKINREDFGLTWNAALETGGVLVSSDVSINAEIQLVKQ